MYHHFEHSKILRSAQAVCLCVWFPEQTAIISLYSMNRLVFKTASECVYCAVRTETSNNAC